MVVRQPLLAVSAITLAAAAACSSSSSSSPDGGGPSPSHDGGQNDGGGDASKCTPATGYEQVAPPDPTGTQDDAHISTVIDGAGNPMVAYVEYDMAGNTLYFTAYDGATCKWKPSVKVATVGNVDYTRDRQVTMSRDPADGHLGIGYQVAGDATGPNATDVMLAQSDDGGATWTSELVAERANDGNGSLVHPTVAMQSGKTYYAYFDTGPGQFHLLSRTAHSGPFTGPVLNNLAPNPMMGFDGFPPALAIDANGNAGMAMFTHTPNSSENLTVVYYSAATGSVAVFDSMGTQNDSPDVALTFEGVKPRIAATLERGTDTGSKVWFSDSNDGTTWSTPVELPQDQGDGMGRWISIAANGKGALTIATDRANSNGIRTCGAPKISTSPDDGTTWTTCGPATNLDGAGPYVQVYYQPSGKRIAGFGVGGNGVWVWREP